MEEEKYDRCFACGSLILKMRIEEHHPFGKEINRTIPLCVLCHDIIDRMPLKNPLVFQEMVENCLEEFKELFLTKPKEFKWLKLYLLKTTKILYEKHGKDFKKKAENSFLKGEDKEPTNL